VQRSPPRPGAGPCLSQAREARKETWGREACIYERHAVLEESKKRAAYLFKGEMKSQARHSKTIEAKIRVRGPNLR
jgi:hypothetical protein